MHWAQQYDEVVWLDSNEYEHQNYPQYQAILAVDAFTSLKTDYTNAFDQLEEYQNGLNDWIFGYLSYDLKNDTERLVSKNDDRLHFADLHFFQPKKLFLIQNNTLEMHYLSMIDDELTEDYNEILNQTEQPISKYTTDLQINAKIHKKAYIEKVSDLLAHIGRGDIYEANFCQEFFATGLIDPLDIYKRLNDISTPPFATFLKLDEQYCLSASPERYLHKEGKKVISQPIKGTAPRGSSEEEDTAFAKALSQDPKEQSENVMIVDLVRNDLSRTAMKGSVQVEEYCKVYPFKQLHQMISTITATISEIVSPVDVIRSTYPMGSMTGAPKIMAMKLIESLEESKRGLYSGSVGYFTPDGNFDFNVVIRSILYNAEKEYISYSVGGAITAGSDPEKEYEECLLKAKAMRAVLEGKS
ncbi:para-aminobenzoate synthetase component 1 [Dokdonia sp. Hel_I_53]|nr:para-aminobenzoate synthetase component 1 [Dokdonia sp. Hel_I_53]